MELLKVSEDAILFRKAKIELVIDMHYIYSHNK